VCMLSDLEPARDRASSLGREWLAAQDASVEHVAADSQHVARPRGRDGPAPRAPNIDRRCEKTTLPTS
jgi:hypothetical protein